MNFLDRYFAWISSGGFKRIIFGLLLPILFLIFVGAALIGGGGEKPSDRTASNAPNVGVDAPARTAATAPEVQPSVVVPTATPPPPTPTAEPKPVIYDGVGDNVISITPGPALLYVKGNAGARYFGVTGYDAQNKQTDLFVNTTSAYAGTVPLDFAAGDKTTQLEIQAEGSWRIEIWPLAAANIIDAPGRFQGGGDEVLRIRGQAQTAAISGNQGGRYFGVVGWGDRSNLMVNTTSPYNGRVRIAGGTLFLEVTAVGAWEIVLE